MRMARRTFVAGAIASAFAPAALAYPVLSARVSVAQHAGALLAGVSMPPDPACIVRIPAVDRNSSWAAPLDRIVTLRQHDVALRDVLDRVASDAKVDLSYSSELLPRDKRVCVSLERVSIGAVLETLLAGTALRAIVIGSTQVVLAPSRATPTGDVVTSTRRASVLDRVVVTGTPDGASQRGSPFALDVIEGTTLSTLGVSSLGAALDLTVPGMWSWAAAAGSVSARYGSIRGASSFGVSAPKIYLDGIEVANPLLVTQLDPARIDRVEVIRGPQGAALYGADAISGVVSILTRHDGTPTGAMRVQVASSAGMAATSYAPRDAFVQEHTLSLRSGVGKRTVGLGLSAGTVGAYVPGASEQRVLADMDLRLVRSRSILTGTVRYSMQRANASSHLLLGGLPPALSGTARANRLGAAPGLADERWRTFAGALDTTRYPPPRDSTRFAGDSAIGQQTSQYTVGGTMTMMPSLRWTHTVITGVDGYRLTGLSNAGLPSPAITAVQLTNAQGAADRGSLRLRSVGRFDLADRTSLSVTFAAEQAVLRAVDDLSAQPILTRVVSSVGANTSGTSGTGGAGGGAPGGVSGATDGGKGVVSGGAGANAQSAPPGGTQWTSLNPPTAGYALGRQALRTTWSQNGGLSAQGNLAFDDRWFVVAGGRVERSTGITADAQVALLPMLGAAYVHDVRGVALKWRTAYGTGIRPVQSLTRGASWMGRSAIQAANSLQPESQSGVETGVDVLVGRSLVLHVTRFDQRASGLIQPVAVTTLTPTVGGRTVRSMSYLLENVGAITNRGWELQGSTQLRQLSLAATVSLVDSRVARVASGYRGDLRVGDRMLDVPARTASVSATWTASRWSASTGLTRAEDWIGYDRLAIGEALAESTREGDLSGAMLRNYWVRYGGVSRLRANVSYRLVSDVSMRLSGENLLNVQRGAPDNATVTAGRTLSFGLRTSF